MSEQYESFGIGVLKVSACMLAEFASQKPENLEIIGSQYNHNSNFPCVSLILKGPMIPTIPDTKGIPEVICTVTKLEDGSLEWDFAPDPHWYTPVMHRCCGGETGISTDPAKLIKGMQDAVKALGL